MISGRDDEAELAEIEAYVATYRYVRARADAINPAGLPAGSLRKLVDIYEALAGAEEVLTSRARALAGRCRARLQAAGTNDSGGFDAG
jgi:hypothetical protein